MPSKIRKRLQKCKTYYSCHKRQIDKQHHVEDSKKNDESPTLRIIVAMQLSQLWKKQDARRRIDSSMQPVSNTDKNTRSKLASGGELENRQQQILLKNCA